MSNYKPVNETSESVTPTRRPVYTDQSSSTMWVAGVIAALVVIGAIGWYASDSVSTNSPTSTTSQTTPPPPATTQPEAPSATPPAPASPANPANPPASGNSTTTQ